MSSLKSYLSLIVTVIAIISALGGGLRWGLNEATQSINANIDAKFDEVKTQWTFDSRIPHYSLVANQIKKQKEKIDKQPDDIKYVDIEFLYNQCNADEFTKKYLPTLPPTERATIHETCDQLGNLYIARTKY